MNEEIYYKESLVVSSNLYAVITIDNGGSVSAYLESDDSQQDVILLVRKAGLLNTRYYDLTTDLKGLQLKILSDMWQDYHKIVKPFMRKNLDKVFAA